MGLEIDRYITELQFRGEQFFSGVKQGISSINDLKTALELRGADQGLNSIQNTISNMSFLAINNGLDTVGRGFSAMEQIAIGVLRSIGYDIEQLGKKLVNEVVTKQFRAGWGKYEDITKSVQTIIAATGKSIEEVTQYTDRLNWFTDETSFNLTDMTSNISKFTSAGIDLDKATVQMMGIGNASALAGSSIQNASHAMMGFSKAIASGYMSRLQWSWIETAHMDTIEFKQTLIDAAVAAGELVKVNGKLYARDVRRDEDHEVSAEKLRDTLHDKWLTKEVMEAALETYGGFSEDLGNLYDMLGSGKYYTTNNLLEFIDEFHKGNLDMQKMSKLTGISVDDLQKEFEKLDKAAIKSVNDSGEITYTLGRKAFAAAQEAITAKQAWDALVDAVSTGWMRTFQLIFGNYEEAKKLWTNLANWLYELFAESGNVRNAILSDWHVSDTGGYKDFITGLNNMMDAVTSFRDILKEVFGDFIPEIFTVDNLTSFTSKFLGFTESLTTGLGRVKSFLTLYKETASPFRMLTNEGQPSVSSRSTSSITDRLLGDDLSTVVEDISDDVEETVDVWQQNYLRMREREAAAKAETNRINTFYQNLFYGGGTKELAQTIADVPDKPLITKALDNFNRISNISKFYESLYDGTNELYDATTKADLLAESNERDRVEKVFTFYQQVYENAESDLGTVKETPDPPKKSLITRALDKYNELIRINEFYSNVYANTSSELGELKDNEDPPSKGLVTKALDHYHSIMSFYTTLEDNLASPELLDAMNGGKNLANLKDPKDTAINLAKAAADAADAASKTKTAQEFYNELYESQEEARSKTKKGIKNKNSQLGTVYDEDYYVPDDSYAKQRERTLNFWKQLYDLLSGVESAVKVVRTAFESLWNSLKTIFEPGKVLIDDFVNLFGAIGRRVKQIGDNLLENNKIGEFFDKFTDFGKGPVQRVINFFHGLLEAITALIDPEVESNLSEFGESIKNLLSGLWEGAKELGSRLFPILTSAWNTIKTILTGIFDTITNFVSQIDTKNIDISVGKIFKIISGLFSVNILRNINELTKKTDTFAGRGLIGKLIDVFFGDNEGGVLGRIGDSFADFTSKISNAIAKFTDTKLLKEFANSILKIALSILVLAMIPIDQLTNAGVVLGAIIVLIIKLFDVVSKMNFGDIASVTAMGTAIAGLGTGLLMISAALALLSILNPRKMWGALGAIAAFVAELTVMFYLLSSVSWKSIIATAAAFVLIAPAMLVLAGTIALLGLIDSRKITAGMTAFTGALIRIAGTLAAMTFIVNNMKGGEASILAVAAAFLVMAPALLIMAGAIAILGALPAGMSESGLGAIFSLLLQIGLYLGLLAKFVDPVAMIAAAGAMLIISPAILIMSAALGVLGLLLSSEGAQDGLMNGMRSLIGLLLGIVGAAALLQASGAIVALVALAGSIVAISLAMIGLAAAIAIGAIGIGAAIAIVTGGIGGMLEKIGGAFDSIGEKFRNFWARIKGESVEGAEGVAEEVESVIQTFPSEESGDESGSGFAIGWNNAALGNIDPQAVMDMVKQVLGDDAPELGLTADDLANVFSGGLMDGMVAPDYGSTVDMIAAAITEKIPTLESAGYSAGYSAGAATERGYRDATSVKSPSRVFMRLMDYVAQGIIIGGERNLSDIYAVGSELGNTLVTSTEDALGPFNGNGYGFSPHITPVIDMSNAGALSFGATLTPNAARSLGMVSADIRDQRESMNDYIDQAVTSAINGMRDELTFVVPLEVDGRQFAASTARFTRSELNLMDRNAMRKGGLINA